MKFQCENGHVFHYPAKLLTTQLPSEETAKVAEKEEIPVFDTLETSVCPYPDCQTIKFSEYVEPAEDTEKVLVIELTTCPQIAIDKALADGYKVVARYAKQYILEKTKTVEATIE